MKMSKQRWIVIGSMTLLLAAACVLNYRLSTQNIAKADAQAMAQATQQPEDTPVSLTDNSNLTTTAGFFSQYKLERDQKRTDEMTYLDSLLEDTSSDEATLNQARQLKMDIAQSLEKELAVETLLHAKGYENAAVVFHEDAVNVIIGKKELTEQEVANILEVVLSETGQSPENVKIIPVE